MTRRARCVGALLWCVMLPPVAAMAGQGAPLEQPGRPTWYVGASAVWWHSARGEEDEAGAGYLYTNFHGAPGGDAPGLSLVAGRFVSRRVSLQGELSVRRAYVGPMSEDSRAKFEVWHLDSTYAHREFLASVFARWHPSGRTRKVTVEPLAGFTVSRANGSLTGRTGTYTYLYGSMPIRRSDESWTWTALGAGGGADALVFVDRRWTTALVVSARFHWMVRQRRSEVIYKEIPPGVGAATVHVGVGLQWTWRARERDRPAR